MAAGERAIVYDTTGAQGWFDRNQFAVEDVEHILVQVEGGQLLLVPFELLLVREDGDYDLPLRFVDLGALGAEQDVDPTASATTAEETYTVPVVAEEATVEKNRFLRAKVRINKTVSEREVSVDEPLVHEHVDVERVPVNEIVHAVPRTRQEGDTLIVPVLEEVLVVEKRLLLREEIRVRRTRETTQESETITLRREHVNIERSDTDSPATGATTEQP